MQHIQVAF